MVSKRVIFGAFLLLVLSNFLYFGAFMIKQLFHSRLLDMRLVIANSALRVFTISYPMRAHGITVNYQHLITGLS